MLDFLDWLEPLIWAEECRLMLRRRVNRVLVRGFLPQSGHLAAEVDNRPDGLNESRNGFFADETTHLLVHAGP